MPFVRSARPGPARVYSERNLFVRQIPRVRPDVDRQVAIESAGGRDLVQVERGRHAFEGPGEFLAVRQEPDDLVMLHGDPLRFVVDDDGALCGRWLRCVAEQIRLGHFGGGGQAGCGKRKTGKGRNEPFHVNLHFDSWNEIAVSAPESRGKHDARPGPATGYSSYAGLCFSRQSPRRCTSAIRTAAG